jgi:drug/metabolite transporter (DMT)-like permease
MDGNARAIIRACGAVLLWSTAASAFKLTLVRGDPWQAVMVASATSTMVFFGACRGRPGPFSPPLLLQGAVRGFLNPFLYYMVLLTAYSMLPAQVAMVVNYLWPVTLTILAVPLLGQRLEGRNMAGILVSFGGVALMALIRGGAGGDVGLLPLFLAFSSTVIWALYWVLNTRASGRVPANLFLNFCFGTLYLALWGLFTGRRIPADPGLLAGGAYIGVFEMGVTFLLWNTALKMSDRASRVSGLIYFTPFLSLAVIAMAVHEPIAPSTFAGLLLVIAGVLIGDGLNKNNKPRQRIDLQQVTN